MFALRMRRVVTILILIYFIAIGNCFAVTSELPLDTILNRAMSAAAKYNELVDNYRAEVYVRSYVETVKKNFLYKYTHLIPNFVLHDPKNDDALIETISDLRYQYPNTYVQDIRHVIGTLTRKKEIDLIPYEFLNINIYGETTNDESFFMPIRFSTAKYYRYSLYQTFTSNEKEYYNIQFSPIYENPKLLNGSFIIEKGTWRVIYFRGEGLGIFSNFSFDINMGDEWVTNYLRRHHHLSYSFLLGIYLQADILQSLSTKRLSCASFNPLSVH